MDSMDTTSSIDHSSHLIETKHRGRVLRSLWFGLTMLLCGFYVIYQAHAHANGQGIGGKTQKGGNTSGCTCHCASASSATTVSFSTSATSIITSHTYTFTVTVSNSSESGAGVEVAAQRGTLTAGTGTQVISGELTHTSAASGLPASWSFSYTAPATSGTDTLFGTGNAVNLDGTNGGGNCTDNWNFSPKYVINVVDPPVTKAIAIGRSTIPLGSIRVGQTKKDTTVIKSTSTSAISVSTSLNSGAPFSRFPTSTGRSISGGSQEIDTVYFAPTSRGNFADSLIVTSDVDVATDQRKAIYVTGTGIQGVYSGGTSLAFNGVRTNTTRRMGFVYSNTGDDTIFFQTPSISGTGFTIATQPTKLSLPPSTTDSIVVQFAPTAKQTYSGTLTLNATGFTIPSVALTGSGIAPAISVTSPTNIGGVRVNSQTQGTVIIKNTTGTDSLHITGVTISGSGAARFNAGSFSPSIQPTGQGTLAINYFPNAEKYDTAVVAIASDDPVNPSVNVTIIGQGLAPHIAVQQQDTLDFGNVRLNSTASRDISIQNTGSDILNLTNVVVSPPPFTLKSKATSVDVGSSASVSVNFTPLTVGKFTGSVVISSDDANKPTSTVYIKGAGINSSLNVPSSVDFGGVATSGSVDSIVTIQNTGAASVTILGYKLTPATVYSFKDTTAHTIAGNSSIHFTVTFKPSAAQNYPGTVTLSTDDPNSSTITIGLTGHGLSGALGLTQSTIDFGTVDSGSQHFVVLGVTNSGAASLGVSGATLTGANASAFTSTPSVQLPATLTAGQQLQITVGFKPLATGPFAGTLHITTADQKSVDVTLKGTSASVNSPAKDTATALLVSDTTEHVSITLKVGQSGSAIAKLVNNATHRLKIDGIGLKHGTHFTATLVSPDSVVPFYLQQGVALDVRVSLTETVPGTYTDTLLVASEQGITSTPIVITAVLQPSGVAMAHENAFILTANPNPSNGIVTLSFAGIRDAQVEVIDAVGRVVYRGTSARDAFTWRGTAQDGLAASGIYMVRVTGKNSVGRAVQAQMPVSITR